MVTSLTRIIFLLGLAPLSRGGTIKLLGLLPMTGKGWIGGGSCVLPCQLAVQDINANSDVLDGYTLAYDYIDTEVRFSLDVFISSGFF